MTYYTKVTFPHGGTVEVMSLDQEGDDEAALSQESAEAVLNAWKDDENTRGRYIAGWVFESYGPGGRRGEGEKYEMACLTKTTRMNGTEFYGWEPYSPDSYHLTQFPEAAAELDWEYVERDE